MKVSGRHAVYVGWVAGIARSNGIDAIPLLEDDVYTDRLLLNLAPRLRGWPRVTITIVVPPPPDDWMLAG